jgi:hypothetical protein
MGTCDGKGEKVMEREKTMVETKCAMAKGKK